MALQNLPLALQGRAVEDLVDRCPRDHLRVAVLVIWGCLRVTPLMLCQATRVKIFQVLEGIWGQVKTRFPTLASFNITPNTR